MEIRILLSKRLGERRWTQADLARKTGIRPNTINELYHELCNRVSLEHLALICEAMDCDITGIVELVPSSATSLPTYQCPEEEPIGDK